MIFRPASLVFSIAVLLALSACSLAPAPDEFRGTPLKGDRQAQDFELTDQFGNTKSLHRDFAGKVVVLTFLYSQCPDVCPIVANHLRDVSEMLDGDSAQTAIVIVSVDPVGDSVEGVLAYSERWQMADRWTYLVGDETALKDVWSAYYIDPYLHGPGSDSATAEEIVEGSRRSAGVSAIVEQSGRVIHSAPIYVIDANGVMRSVFTLPLESQDIVHDVELSQG